MTKEELMKNVKAYVVDGTRSWDDVRDYMACNLRGFTKILKDHELSPMEFICILPYLKEVFLFSPAHVDDDEDLEKFYDAVLDCQQFYAEPLKETPMKPFIDMVIELLKTKTPDLNNKVEMLIYAILNKSRELLENS